MPSKKVSMRASMANKISHFGIMGGLYNRKISGRSSTNRATSRLTIPAGADAGLRYMKMYNLLSRNPLGSGGVGRMFTIRPSGSGLGNHLGNHLGSSSGDKQKYCQAGTFLAPSGVCTPCPVGMYSKAGADECTWCEENTYADHTGSSSCMPCPAGTGSAQGKQQCNKDVSAGMWVQCGSGVCLQPAGYCNPGLYCGGGREAGGVDCPGRCLPEKCSIDKDCPTNFSCWIDPRTCNSCRRRDWPIFGWCKQFCDTSHCSPNTPPCPAGTYRDSSSCTLCPSGTYQPHTGSTRCIQCPAGTSSQAGSTSCTPCTIDPSFPAMPCVLQARSHPQSHHSINNIPT